MIIDDMHLIEAVIYILAGLYASYIGLTGILCPRKKLYQELIFMRKGLKGIGKIFVAPGYSDFKKNRNYKKRKRELTKVVIKYFIALMLGLFALIVGVVQIIK